MPVRGYCRPRTGEICRPDADLEPARFSGLTPGFEKTSLRQTARYVLGTQAESGLLSHHRPTRGARVGWEGPRGLVVSVGGKPEFRCRVNPLPSLQFQVLEQAVCGRRLWLQRVNNKRRGKQILQNSPRPAECRAELSCVREADTFPRSVNLLTPRLQGDGTRRRAEDARDVSWHAHAPGRALNSRPLVRQGLKSGTTPPFLCLLSPRLNSSRQGRLFCRTARLGPCSCAANRLPPPGAITAFSARSFSMEYAGRAAVLCAALLVLLLAADIAGADRDFIIVKRFHGKRVPRQAGGAPVAQQIGSQKKPEIYALDIKSTVTSRYAKTVVTSRLANKAGEAREAEFDVSLPKTAFISNFSMPKRENKFRVSVNVAAQSKVTFNLTYEELLQRRLGSYELVLSVRPQQVVRHLKIDVRIIETRDIVLLVIVHLPNTNLVLSVRPQQVVRHLKIDVRIIETRDIVLLGTGQSHLNIDVRIIETRDIVLLGTLPCIYLTLTGQGSNIVPLKTKLTDVPNIRRRVSDNPPVLTYVPNIRRSVADNTYGAGELEGAEISRPSPNRAHIQYRPSDLQQLRMSPAGISGDFLVRYDVKRDMSVGDIQIVNGYFVHYFAPSGLPVVPKNIVFVIDQSGSMQGTKMRQTKHAMNTILKDLREHDRFNVMAFSYGSTTWRPHEMVQATPENIESARTYVRREISANGGTNINQAILDAADLLRRVTDGRPDSPRSASLIIFLTDGLPSSGETRTKNIMVTTHVILLVTLRNAPPTHP
ncbi:hypothetical protein Bbelb_108880 [Branchiostoma belcheri]|nr:hypothetical protein Bbelb_108880 [Branchiostoma belcheri]